MKTNILISSILLVAILTWSIIHFFDRPDPPISSGRITLEQILSVKELHLVRHRYADLFFIHRQNDSEKSIRALVQVPVTITAYINLKEMRYKMSGDTVVGIILPRARMQIPHYHLDSMDIRQTRAFQLHLGKDLYPQVTGYLRTQIGSRIDSIRSIARSNHILTQTETEGKAWMEWFLNSIGRGDIKVWFETEEKLNQSFRPQPPQKHQPRHVIDSYHTRWENLHPPVGNLLESLGKFPHKS